MRRVLTVFLLSVLAGCQTPAPAVVQAPQPSHKRLVEIAYLAGLNDGLDVMQRAEAAIGVKQQLEGRKLTEAEAIAEMDYVIKCHAEQMPERRREIEAQAKLEAAK